MSLLFSSTPAGGMRGFTPMRSSPRPGSPTVCSSVASGIAFQYNPSTSSRHALRPGALSSTPERSQVTVPLGSPRLAAEAFPFAAPGHIAAEWVRREQSAPPMRLKGSVVAPAARATPHRPQPQPNPVATREDAPVARSLVLPPPTRATGKDNLVILTSCKALAPLPSGAESPATTATPRSEATLSSPSSPDLRCQAPPSHWVPEGLCDLRIGACSRKGQKPQLPHWPNQDNYIVVNLGEARALIAVFDGHGQFGHRAAARARTAFERSAPSLLPATPKPLREPEVAAALRHLFAMAKDEIAREVDSQGQQIALLSGTTATAAVIDANAGTLAVAHVGDSSLLVAGASGAVEYKSEDHGIDAAAERRCLAMGGEVRTGRCGDITARRIYSKGSQFPGIMMSRALGDLVATGLGVLSEPEVHTGIPLKQGSTVVVASDGVWEHSHVGLVASEVAQGCDTQVVAQKVVDDARGRWPQEGIIDDVTAVVAQLVPRS